MGGFAQQVMALGLWEFAAVAFPSALFAPLMFALFSALRGRFPQVYASRALEGLPGETAPLELSKRCCGWVFPMLAIQLDKVAATAGMDAAGYIVLQATLFLLLGTLSLP